MRIQRCWISGSAQILGVYSKSPPPHVISFSQTCLHRYHALRNASPDHVCTYRRLLWMKSTGLHSVDLLPIQRCAMLHNGADRFSQDSNISQTPKTKTKPCWFIVEGLHGQGGEQCSQTKRTLLLKSVAQCHLCCIFLPSPSASINYDCCFQ